MDTDSAPPGPTLPRNAPFEPGRHAATPEPQAPALPTPQGAIAVATAIERGDRNGVFGHLVTDDGDIAGLVAYSIYKQNKLDWLRAFEDAKERAPDEAELAAYIIGEGTPRRLATYRHLAEATLAGNGPEIDGGGAARPAPVARRLTQKATLNPAAMALGALIAVVFVVLLWLAAHYTASGH